MNAFNGSLCQQYTTAISPVRTFYLGPWEHMKNLELLREYLVNLGFRDGNKATEDVLFVTAERDYADNFINRGGKLIILVGENSYSMRQAFIEAADPDVRISTFDNVRFVPQFLGKAIRDVVGNRMPELLIERLRREKQEADAAEWAAYRRGCKEWLAERGLEPNAM